MSKPLTSLELTERLTILIPGILPSQIDILLADYNAMVAKYGEEFPADDARACQAIRDDFKTLMTRVEGCTEEQLRLIEDIILTPFKRLIIVSNRATSLTQLTGPLSLREIKRRYENKGLNLQVDLGLDDTQYKFLQDLYEDETRNQLTVDFASLFESVTAKKIIGKKDPFYERYLALNEALIANNNKLMAALEAAASNPDVRLTTEQIRELKKIILANTRMPVYVPDHAAGGLAAAVGAIDNAFDWIGWVGCDLLGDKDPATAESQALLADAGRVMSTAKIHSIPVPLPSRAQEGHYEFFANGALWPIMHGVPKRELSEAPTSEQMAVLTKKKERGTLLPGEEACLIALIENPPIDLAYSILMRCHRNGIAELAEVEIQILDRILTNPVLLFEIEKLYMASAESKFTFEEAWEAYLRVNQAFAQQANCQIAEAIAKGLEPVVWVNDYQMLTVAQGIKAIHPDVKIAYFHHIPFPQPEIFQRMAHHVDLLHAWLQADEIRFHIEEYRENFLATVQTVLGWEVRENAIVNPETGRVVSVQHALIGVDPSIEKPGHSAECISLLTRARASRQRALRETQVTQAAATGAISGAAAAAGAAVSREEEDRGSSEVERSVEDPATKIIFASGRADYTKGLDLLLLAYVELLESEEQYRTKLNVLLRDDPTSPKVDKLRAKIKAIESVVLVLQIAPSRENVLAYHVLRLLLDYYVAQIKRRFGDSRIFFYPKTVDLDGIRTLFQGSEVILVPVDPVDGCNLMCMEALLAMRGKPAGKQDGCVILSKGAGAFKRIGDFVIPVDVSSPEIRAHIVSIKKAMLRGLLMSQKEKSKLASAAQERIDFDGKVDSWAAICLRFLGVVLPSTLPLPSIVAPQGVSPESMPRTDSGRDPDWPARFLGATPGRFQVGNPGAAVSHSPSALASPVGSRRSRSVTPASAIAAAATAGAGAGGSRFRAPIPLAEDRREREPVVAATPSPDRVIALVSPPAKLRLQTTGQTMQALAEAGGEPHLSEDERESRASRRRRGISSTTLSESGGSAGEGGGEEAALLAAGLLPGAVPDGVTPAGVDSTPATAAGSSRDGGSLESLGSRGTQGQPERVTELAVRQLVERPANLFTLFSGTMSVSGELSTTLASGEEDAAGFTSAKVPPAVAEESAEPASGDRPGSAVSSGEGSITSLSPKGGPMPGPLASLLRRFSAAGRRVSPLVQPQPAPVAAGMPEEISEGMGGARELRS
ncbi:MAG: hypothetical protein A3E87_09030 [Gammaproteobacteria bacterium RIFCSPHIGHO2_12_FULL_35_23]|nr:MAG: hypothetical protein A3E87_09030 [Gammaproteobacteria bacterium RIFCSPHIGHO2_12_FULL_35_23]